MRMDTAMHAKRGGRGASVEPHTWGIWDGREINKVQVWRSPEGMVIIENPQKLGQIAFTPAQWAKVTAHVAEPRCTCSDVGGDALCPEHDRELIAKRDAKRIAEQS